MTAVMTTTDIRGQAAKTGFIPKGMSLLQDFYPLKVLDSKDVISESVAGGRKCKKIIGIFQEADVRNSNGRIYPYEILKKSVEDIMPDVEARCVWGELDHATDAKINLDRISHLITRLWFEGKKLHGEAELMCDLPHGKQLTTLLRHGTVGISSRGIGEVREIMVNGEESYEVLEDYKIVTFDAVADPSVVTAVLQLQESRNRMGVNSKQNVQQKEGTVFAPAIYQSKLVHSVTGWLNGN